MLPKWFIPLTVTITAGLSIWLLTTEAPKQPQLIAEDNSVPDAFMDNFTIHSLDVKGKPRHELRAVHMSHFPVDDHSDFTSPHVTLYQSGKQRWSLMANTGHATKDIEEVILRGEVNIHRLDLQTGNPDLTIKTAELLIRPDESYLETDHKVSITSGKQSLQSLGMRANLDDGKLEFLSKVRGVYAL